MRPKDHVILGGLAGAALYPVFGAESLLFWGASFAIDIDHYLDYIYHNGFTDFSFKKMFEYHGVLDRFWYEVEFLNIEIFHTLEFMGPLYFLSLAPGLGFIKAVFWGFLFHIVLDMIYLYWNGIFFLRAYSFAEYYIRKRRLEEKGYRPEAIYFQAIKIINGSDENIR